MSIEKIAAKTLGVKGLEEIKPSDFGIRHNLTRQQIRAALRAARNEGYDLAKKNVLPQFAAELKATAQLVALRELFYCVKDHLRGCGDPHAFKRAFDRVQIELDEPMMHVA